MSPAAALMRALWAVVVTALVAGCAAFGVAATDDPGVKLNDAEHLVHTQLRPLPAEQMIMEAIEIYAKQGDAHGLAAAHRGYADLLRSAAVVKWEKVYRTYGFRDTSVTFDNRFEKAAEYYRKAIADYRRAKKHHLAIGRYDLLTNAYYNLGSSYQAIGEPQNACSAYDSALKAHQESVRRNPGAKPYVPRNFGTFESLIRSAKRRVRCE
jgi:tetratricopeptide (TPR) repeat protein